MANAILHVVGALVATFAFSLLVLLIVGWEQERTQKRRRQEVSIALGVPIASLENDEALIPQMIHYSSKRFSAELLRNRFSDLCGFVLTSWTWLSSLLQVGIVIWVGWLIYTSGADNAVYMWFVLAVAIFSWLVSVACSLACLLLTGRYPGEARMARKGLAALIERRGELAALRTAATLETEPET